MLGNIVLEDAYYRFTKTGDQSVFDVLEPKDFPGSPFPISPEFNELCVSTRQLSEAVDNGSLAPSAAASGILEQIGQANYVPPAFGSATRTSAASRRHR